MLSDTLTIGAQCARQRFRYASCRACVDVCPAQALTLEQGRVVVNTEQCIQCAACLFVCPQGAILGVDAPVRYYRDRTLVAPFTLVAPTTEELLLWHKVQGIAAIAVDFTQAKAWESAVSLLNERLRQYGEAGWAVVSPQTSEINVSRRRLFHVQRADVQSAQMQPALRRQVWPQIGEAHPVIDSEKCQLCGACWRACEQQVLLLTEETLQIFDAACTGCQNCVAVCFHQAIRVEKVVRPAQCVAIHTARRLCKMCQKSFLTFDQNAQNCLCCQRHQHGMRR